jgi:hypothetical protein
LFVVLDKRKERFVEAWLPDRLRDFQNTFASPIL